MSRAADSESEAIDGEVLPPDGVQGPSWLEPFPARYRQLRAGIAAVLGIAPAVWIGIMQFQAGIFGHAPSFWILVPLVIGAWRFRYWMDPALPAARKYASVTVLLTIKERAKQSAPVWVTGFVGAALILWVQYEHDQVRENWGWLAPFFVMGLGGLLMFAFRKTEARLTPEAAKARSYYDYVAKQEAEGKETRFDAFFDQAIVRYPLAAMLFWFAYQWAEQPNLNRNSWLALLFAVGLGMWFAREIFKWLLGIAIVGGIFWGLFAGVAALPVSVAVIIGALIIAAAAKSR